MLDQHDDDQHGNGQKIAVKRQGIGVAAHVKCPAGQDRRDAKQKRRYDSIDHAARFMGLQGVRR